MNNPEYILVDVMGEIVAAVKEQLALPVLNYQYGTEDKLKETLIQWSKTPENVTKKYPLIWVVQPFTIGSTELGFYGEVKGGLRLFIIEQSNQGMKAPERMTTKFKPVIYPIRREFFNQLNLHPAISHEYNRKYQQTDRYSLGWQSVSALTDVIDTTEISQLQLKINNNQNCP